MSYSGSLDGNGSKTQYWVHDAHETMSYTKIHWTNRPGLPECYRGGPEKDWHGPFDAKADAERMADSLMRVESGECHGTCETRV